MSIPEDCRMTPTHEWHRAEGNTVTVGITQFAADELTDIMAGRLSLARPPPLRTRLAPPRSGAEAAMPELTIDSATARRIYAKASLSGESLTV